MPCVFGILSSSGMPTGITGAVVNSSGLTTAGEKKELTGNPPTDIIDVRMLKIIQTLSVKFNFTAIPSPEAAKALIGTEVTVVITSMDTQAVSFAGKMLTFDVAMEKESWWEGTFTVEAVTTP